MPVAIATFVAAREALARNELIAVDRVGQERLYIVSATTADRLRRSLGFGVNDA